MRHLKTYVDGVIAAHEPGNALVDRTALEDGRGALLYAVAEELERRWLFSSFHLKRKHFGHRCRRTRDHESRLARQHGPLPHG